MLPSRTLRLVLTGTLLSVLGFVSTTAVLTPASDQANAQTDCTDLAQIIAGLNVDLLQAKQDAEDFWEDSEDVRDRWEAASQALDDWFTAAINETGNGGDYDAIWAEYLAAESAYNDVKAQHESLLAEAQEIRYLRDYWVEIYAGNCV